MESKAEVYISVISHGHRDIIKKLACLEILNLNYNVVVKVNNEDPELVSYLKLKGIEYIKHSLPKGFGENNNEVFNYCLSHLGMKSNDYFIVLNPDVYIDTDDVSKLVMLSEENKILLSCIDLYKDSDYQISDDSVRRFPVFSDFVKSYLFSVNNTIINKSTMKFLTEVDWAAGSFLCFRASWYRELSGFNECYFMYCEDIDLCYRSSSLGHRLTYIPQIKALHLAGLNNRRFLSKHFFWHISSTLRFLLSKYVKCPVKSSIR
ncbi:glycosyltransferase family 2 protein [Photobacterium profundum]|uniref:glycosyltransferase family 2 protein n=1 Tax=Photobacterium profundum TaxID=74109 RepID=UPI003D10FF3D